MKVVMLGVNHRTAPVAFREKLALAGQRLEQALDAFRDAFAHAEAVVISTCNRTEFYVAQSPHHGPTADDLRRLLAETCEVPLAELTAVSVHREQQEAIGNLFRVCAGLDSMVLGEPQILGQVKRAYEAALARQTVGPVLHRVFQQALAAAKRVRTQTGLDSARLSVASVAVDFARQVFEYFEDKVIVGIGAGEMAKTTLRHLLALQPRKLWLTNRTVERAVTLADQLALRGDRGGPRSFNDLDALLIEADIVLTGTGSTEPIITAERFRPLLRKRRNRPLFVIDIAVPRDVDPQVGTLANVYLYNIDDLQRVIAANHEQLAEQVRQCDSLLQDAVKACLADVQHRDVGQMIRLLRERLHRLGQEERQRTARKLMAAAPDDYEAALEELTTRLINKILHLPLSQLDRRNTDAPLGFYAAALRRLFRLDEPCPHGQEPPVDEASHADDQASRVG